jgi:hypothetical protein
VEHSDRDGDDCAGSDHPTDSSPRASSHVADEIRLA